MAAGPCLCACSARPPPLRSNSGFIDACVSVLQDPNGKDRKVKRRCAACLGELLFYIATQSAEDRASAQVWGSAEEGACPRGGRCAYCAMTRS